MKSKKSIPLDLENIIPLLINVWRRLHKEAGPKDKLQTREFRGVVAGVKSLQEGSFEGKSLIGQNYFENIHLLGSYLLYQWVVHYQEGISLLGELPSPPRRVLDLCSGAAPFSFAALRHGAKEVFAVDQSALALQQGAEICGRYGLTLNIRKANCLKNIPVEGKFDLIILGYGLEELFPKNSSGWKEKQQVFIKHLLNLLTTDGYLLIVDKSFQEENQRVLQLRDQLVKEQVWMQAPCIWQGECPALKTPNSPCYAQREFEKPYLLKEIQRAASINLSSLKMTYLLIRSPSAPQPTYSEKNLYRVISPPIDTFHGKRFYLCGTEGKKTLGSNLANLPQKSRAFDYLRRGELISIENAVEKPMAFDIQEETEILVKAACGKPFISKDLEEKFDDYN